MTELLLPEKKLQVAKRIYLALAAFFIAALITCNIIANKFVSIDLGFKTFVISVGVLPYPITFLITDILSEFYGRRRTNEVVISGFLVSIFVLFILWLGNAFPAIPGSPVGDDAYNMVFQNSWRIISASMLAYLVAQLVDVRVFHFWKRITKGKKLWLRNNFSTAFSQLVDTVLVVTVIFFGLKGWSAIADMVFDGWLFKVICAALDTAIIYPVAWGFRKYFGLEFGQELRI
jgi:queuosine precursor transporter